MEYDELQWNIMNYVDYSKLGCNGVNTGIFSVREYLVSGNTHLELISNDFVNNYLFKF